MSHGGDERFNWVVSAVVFATMTEDVATKCGITLQLLSPSGKLIESDVELATVEVGFGNMLKADVLTESRIGSVQVVLSLLSEPSWGTEGDRKDITIRNPTVLQKADDVFSRGAELVQ